MNSFFILLLLICSPLSAGKFEAIEIYSQDDLNKLIIENKHLQRVKADDCQLIEDIKAHAIKIKEPSYTYLWGDMLAWGVCVEKDPRLGMFYIKKSAQQGLLPALEQLGRYYRQGILVEKNPQKAIVYFRDAALQGNVKAQLHYIEMLLEGFGSPLDYEEAYQALFNSVLSDERKHAKASYLLNKLAIRMPDYVVKRARDS